LLLIVDPPFIYLFLRAELRDPPPNLSGRLGTGEGGVTSTAMPTALSKRPREWDAKNVWRALSTAASHRAGAAVSTAKSTSSLA
jgi:hypothetical protein